MPYLKQSSLTGPFLTLDNIDQFASLIPAKDRHLLDPPKDIEKPLLLDLLAILNQYQNQNEARKLFSLLIEENINNDRIQRVSQCKPFNSVLCSHFEFNLMIHLL